MKSFLKQLNRKKKKTPATWSYMCHLRPCYTCKLVRTKTKFVWEFEMLAKANFLEKKNFYNHCFVTTVNCCVLILLLRLSWDVQHIAFNFFLPLKPVSKNMFLNASALVKMHPLLKIMVNYNALLFFINSWTESMQHDWNK